jgi:5'-3' exonuclease
MFDKKFLNQVLASLENDKSTKDSRVLVVDSMNTFIRNFASVNLINPTGHHIGGLVGYLRSLGSAVRMFRPTRIILVFDGVGSSHNKKNLYPDYKGNRNTSRVTNWDTFDDKEEESEAMVNQMTRLVHYLKQLPVSLISIDKIEADDSIGFIADYYENNEDCSKVTILSSDKDFYQLISDKVQIYSPTKKKVFKIQDVLDEFNVHPNNFLIYKTLLGDNSDNLPGIFGVGHKKIIKLFPLNSEKEHSFVDIMNISEENIKTNPSYKKILAGKQQLNINYQLMNIRKPNISEYDKEVILNLLCEEITPLNVGKFMVLYDTDGLQNSIQNTQNWLVENFGSLLLK